MKICIPKERRQYERRVAATPDSVKKLVGLGASVTVESGAGFEASISDDAYKDAGAQISNDIIKTLGWADVILKVQRPLRSGEGQVDELGAMKNGANLISILSPYNDPDSLPAYKSAGITAFAMEFMPRITRAQSMDVLSSQSNLAGYKAVLDGASEYGRVFPMMMTAAGTVAPARVMIMGVGVAGLQAIATAKRLGAIVSATDVRAATKEQVESLGGKFVMVEMDADDSGETEGGYAKEMSEDYKKRQAELIADTIKKQDIVITTALIPGRPAPLLISEDMLKSMKPGSVIVDLAVEQGGNCALAKAGEVVVAHGVKIVGHNNVPSRLAADASQLYSKNLLNFMELLICEEEKALTIDWEDEIVIGTALTKDGKIIHEAFKGKN
ncbi:MAG: Re/Si-specific NAD(P)(+) transhydrogenase subunit alpha [Sphingomonadales bacterium]